MEPYHRIPSRFASSYERRTGSRSAPANFTGEPGTETRRSGPNREERQRERDQERLRLQTAEFEKKQKQVDNLNRDAIGRLKRISAEISSAKERKLPTFSLEQERVVIMKAMRSRIQDLQDSRNLVQHAVQGAQDLANRANLAKDVARIQQTSAGMAARAAKELPQTARKIESWTGYLSGLFFEGQQEAEDITAVANLGSLHELDPARPGDPSDAFSETDIEMLIHAGVDAKVFSATESVTLFDEALESMRELEAKMPAVPTHSVSSSSVIRQKQEKGKQKMVLEAD